MPDIYSRSFLLAVILAVLASIPASADDIMTEVIITVQDDAILAFSAYKSEWVAEDLKLSEIVVSKQSKGNGGTVITSKRILGFSALANRWRSVTLRMNEQVNEMIVEGNAATVRTNMRIFGFSAHTGRWIEGP